MPVKRKRAYDKPMPHDGYRVLVDRLWPRGVSRKDLKIEEWVRDIAPSDELRTWFGHDRARWDEFRKRYKKELHRHVSDLDRLAEIAAAGTLTLVYGARDTECNNAAAIAEFLREHYDV